MKYLKIGGMKITQTRLKYGRGGALPEPGSSMAGAVPKPGSSMAGADITQTRLKYGRGGRLPKPGSSMAGAVRNSMNTIVETV